MRRRAVLGTAALWTGAHGGCLSNVFSCQGVELAIRLESSEPADAGQAIDLAELDLSDRQRSLLEDATTERLITCTRSADERSEALQGLIVAVAEKAGYDDGDIYYSDKRVRFPVRFDGRRYRAELVFDTAESAGGPL